MRLKINPNRMENLKLKKRLQLAKRGHKLLKDKQDELIRHFVSLISEIKERRARMEENLTLGFKEFLSARLLMMDEEVHGFLGLSGVNIELKVDTNRIMNIKVPVFKITKFGTYRSYGFSDTTPEVDKALKYLEMVFDEMIRLAELEKKAKLLAEEIDKTRRRVNALEYLLIPNIEETISYINMKLQEQERSSIIQLMKVKDMIEEKLLKD